MCYLYLKLKFKIKGIFGKKSPTQRCAESGSFFYIQYILYLLHVLFVFKIKI